MTDRLGHSGLFPVPKADQHRVGQSGMVGQKLSVMVNPVHHGSTTQTIRMIPMVSSIHCATSGILEVLRNLKGHTGQFAQFGSDHGHEIVVVAPSGR